MSLADYHFWIAYKRLELLLAGGEPDWGAEVYALMRAVWGAWS